ncbi:MAG: hypothetical protein AAFR70_00330 [Pseudomonadota bacterium]
MRDRKALSGSHQAAMAARRERRPAGDAGREAGARREAQTLSTTATLREGRPR